MDYLKPNKIGSLTIALENYVSIFQDTHLTHGGTKIMAMQGECPHFESMRTSVEPDSEFSEASFTKSTPGDEIPFLVANSSDSILQLANEQAEEDDDITSLLKNL